MSECVSFLLGPPQLELHLPSAGSIIDEAPAASRSWGGGSWLPFPALTESEGVGTR